MKAAVHEQLNLNREALVNTLAELIRIESVAGESGPDAPYGPGPAAALDAYLAMGEEMGFRTGNAGQAAGHIYWHPEGGEAGPEDAGVLVHLDVVPAEASDWTYPPYSGTVTDGRIYGRGSQDNKGPAAAALFALKALKDAGFRPSRGIRLIAGTCEETGSSDIPRYLKDFPSPGRSIVPDGCYPVVHGEMGIMGIRLSSSLPAAPEGGAAVREIRGGSYANMVPDSCLVRLEGAPADAAALRATLPPALAPHASITDGEGGLLVETRGKAVHASLPEKGVNAISLMMELLAGLPFPTALGDFAEFYNRRIGRDYYGRRMGCGCSDPVSGDLRFNAGVLGLKEGRIGLDLNIRYPVTADGQTVFDAVRSACLDEGVEAELLYDSRPLYFPKKDPFIEMLHREYMQVTGDRETQPLVMGGGTYARALKNAAAIGAISPFSEERAHQADEYILIEDLMASARIYAGILMEMAG